MKTSNSLQEQKANEWKKQMDEAVRKTDLLVVEHEEIVKQLKSRIKQLEEAPRTGKTQEQKKNTDKTEEMTREQELEQAVWQLTTAMRADQTKEAQKTDLIVQLQRQLNVTRGFPEEPSTSRKTANTAVEQGGLQCSRDQLCGQIRILQRPTNLQQQIVEASNPQEGTSHDSICILQRHTGMQQETNAASSSLQDQPHGQIQILQRPTEMRQEPNKASSSQQDPPRALVPTLRKPQEHPQKTNMASHHEQNRQHRQTRKFHQRPEEQNQSENNSSSTVRAYEEEIRQLNELLRVQEQETTNGSRQGQLKKERQKNEELQKDLNEKDEKYKVLEKYNILICTNQDLNRNLKGKGKDATDMKYDRKNQLDGIRNRDQRLHIENAKLQANLNQYLTENKDVKDQVQRLEEKCRSDFNVLCDQLRKEQNRAASLQTSMTKSNHQARQEKEALESSVAKLTSTLDQEKQEKEKEQNRVKELQQRMEEQEVTFSETIRKCYAVYQGGAQLPPPKTLT
ncbi:hypothetical protein WMY93_010867 [Mugilogobius chulae]|uniref:Uncharacterized protein n=1 Tax=Mugilogobius chulae TaxID=88201 RepID=A0AAW0P8N7_9GOBI